jgi:hypothetical protein
VAVVAQQKAVFIAGLGARHIGCPVPVRFQEQGVTFRVPLVERADNGYFLGVGRPYAKSGASRVWNSAHTLLQGKDWGGRMGHVEGQKLQDRFGKN